MRRTSILLATGVLLAWRPVLGAPSTVTFTAAPKAVRDGETVKIAFEVSDATDVEVAVLDADGKVIRHLAAGLLGPNAPEPLQKGALGQSIVWDRRDDDGKPLSGGAFKAVVRLGLTAAFDRVIQGPGSELESPCALGVGPDGEVYVLASFEGAVPPRMYVLDRAGKYLRTILPSPAGLKREQLKGLEPIKLADGTEAPVVYNGHSASLMPFMTGLSISQQLFVTAQGLIVFSSGGRTNEDQVPRRHVMAIRPDSSMPPETGFVGPGLGPFPDYTPMPPTQLAVSPDGKTIYVVGVLSGKNPGHAVCRLNWDSTGPPTPFIGKLDQPGSGGEGLRNPAGLTVDAKGNIYVADAGNGRVAVFDSQGRFVGETKVSNPGHLCVHPKSGAVYVVSSPEPVVDKHAPPRAAAVVKLDKAVGGKELARFEFKAYRHAPVLTLDPGAEPARLWLSYTTGWSRPAVLIPLADGDGKFAAGEDPLHAANGDGRLSNPLFMAVDPVRGQAYVNDPVGRSIRMVDLNSGKIGGKFVTGTDAALDRDGNLYTLEGYDTNALLRYSPDGKPLAFSGTGGNKISVTYRAGHPDVGLYGLTIAPGGDIYVYQGVHPQHLAVFGPDGRLKEEARIRDIPQESASCVAVDRAGNIYAGMNFQDPKSLYPEGLGAEVPPLAWYMPYEKKASWYNQPQHGIPEQPRWRRPYLNFYLFLGGSVFKFAPAGGRVWMGAGPVKAGENVRPLGVPAEAAEYRTACLGRAVWLKGALWRYRGFSPVASRTEGWGDPGCSRWSTGRFSLDDSGRLFVPDVFRFSIGVLDPNGNEIMRFGHYGNIDSAGPKSAIPKPDIPFGWPTSVSVAEDKAYVLDRINRRIVVVKLTYRAEGSCPVN